MHYCHHYPSHLDLLSLLNITTYHITIGGLVFLLFKMLIIRAIFFGHIVIILLPFLVCGTGKYIWLALVLIFDWFIQIFDWGVFDWSYYHSSLFIWLAFLFESRSFWYLTGGSYQYYTIWFDCDLIVLSLITLPCRLFFQIDLMHGRLNMCLSTSLDIGIWGQSSHI